jgi:hypothetical protein
VRVEGGDDHRPALVMTAGDGAADDRLMPEVEAVKIAQRQDGAAKGLRDVVVEGEAVHWGVAVSARITDSKSAVAALDSPQGESYLRPIPIHRCSGGAFVRASVFRLERVQ